MRLAVEYKSLSDRRPDDFDFRNGNFQIGSSGFCEYPSSTGEQGVQGHPALDNKAALSAQDFNGGFRSRILPIRTHSVI
jgi:hypothetical protein